MKKFVATLAVLCLAFTGIFSYFQIREKKGAEASDADYEAQLEAYQKAVAQIPTADAASLYALHPADEAVASINGMDVTWGEYFQAYYSYAAEVEQYMKTAVMYYGSAPAWTDIYDEGTGTRYCDIPAKSAESDLMQKAVIEGYAAANVIELNAENRTKVEEKLAEDRVKYCGEEATEEDFREFLAGNYLTEELYRDMIAKNFLYQQMFTDLYGEDGEKISDADGVKYLQENGYSAAEHILFMTVNRETGETVDEDTAKEKLEQAKEISEELRAIEDDDERLKKLKEYQAEYNEDTGSIAYPDGYTYTAGTMVAEFENAVNGMQEYEVSEPVKTNYGYHVIMRTPLKADAVIRYSDAGKAMTAKSMAANDAYGTDLQEYMDTLKIEYKNGWKAPVLTDFLKETEEKEADVVK